MDHHDRIYSGGNACYPHRINYHDRIYSDGDTYYFSESYNIWLNYSGQEYIY